MTPEQTAAAVKAAVQTLGGAFSDDPKTMRRARQIGLTGWAFHVAGRGGALGDVRADTIAAALGFIAPEAVRDGWDAARKVAAPEEIAAHNLAECCRWGREHLETFCGVARLVELAEQVVVGAEAAGMPLFAAWRAMPLPEDSPGARAAVLAHLLMEHRGQAHLLAIRASGLTPLEAIIAGPDGETDAVAFGWQPPYPSPGPIVRRLMWAESVADSLAGQAYAQLDRAERVELIGLLASLSHRLAR